MGIITTTVTTTTTATATAAFAVSGVQCSARSPYTGAVTKQTLIAHVVARAAERARLVEIDNAEKHAAWIATLEELRTKKGCVDVEEAPAGEEPRYYPSEKTYTLQDFLDAAAPAPGVDTDKAIWWNGSSEAVAPVIESAPALSTTKPKKSPPTNKRAAPATKAPAATTASAKVAAPASATASAKVAAPAPAAVKKSSKTKSAVTAKKKEEKSALLADVVQEVRPGDFPVPTTESANTEPVVVEAVASGGALKEKVEEKKRSTTQETGDSLSGLKKLGADLVDAIVDGVEGTGSKKKNINKAQSPATIPDNVVAAVEEGKLKALTVTKLRRMLSECGLKTSGRKSELIARLTSAVRS